MHYWCGLFIVLAYYTLAYPGVCSDPHKPDFLTNVFFQLKYPWILILHRTEITLRLFLAMAKILYVVQKFAAIFSAWEGNKVGEALKMWHGKHFQHASRAIPFFSCLSTPIANILESPLHIVTPLLLLLFLPCGNTLFRHCNISCCQPACRRCIYSIIGASV